MPCAIITGTSGQDGSYLSEFLLSKGYHIYGMIRRSSSMISLERLKVARKSPNLHLIYGDMTDVSSIHRLFRAAMADPTYADGPLEVYNLAAQSHVKVSFETPIYTANADAVGVLNILDVIVSLNLERKVRFYQASTSELYGDSPPPQSETTPFQPRSPYAIAKLYAYWMVRNYREAHGIFAVNGILFNHESERRGETFVSRKITRAVAAYYHNNYTAPVPVLTLGNIHALRDWGHAADYVQAMWLMLHRDEPDDFAIGTGQSHTVKEFVELAFSAIGVSIRWEGADDQEKGYDAATGTLLIKIDPHLYRLTEVNHLCCNPQKSVATLGWKPATSFDKLVESMVQSDLSLYTTS